MRHTAAVHSHLEAPVARSPTVEQAGHSQTEELADHTLAAHTRWVEQVDHIALAAPVARIDRTGRTDLVVVHSLMVARRCRNRHTRHIHRRGFQMAEVERSRPSSLGRRSGADIHNHRPAHRTTLWLG
jgi:hypothetical protein